MRIVRYAELAAGCVTLGVAAHFARTGFGAANGLGQAGYACLAVLNAAVSARLLVPALFAEDGLLGCFQRGAAMADAREQRRLPPAERLPWVTNPSRALRDRGATQRLRCNGRCGGA